MREPSLAVSLNEAETLATKAARGAGLSWGEAEDLGRSARWLAARGIDWAGPLLELLHSPAERAGVNTILAAADRIAARVPGREGLLGFCRPAWALAILAATAPGRTHLTLRGAALRVRLSPGGLASTEADPFDLAQAPATEIRVEAASDAQPLARVLAPETRRSTVSAGQMDQLGSLAARTYVPASAESRRRGAGGSQIDDA